MAHEAVGIGMIGVGMIGKSHLKRYADIPGARIVALAEINAEEAQRVASDFGVPNVYSDFRKLLERDDIEAVDVCLHNNLHAPATIAALKAGKHVYCEKPMAGSFFDAQAMYEAARKTGKKLHIQLSQLYAPEHKIAKRLIDDGLLGRLYHARSFGFRRRGRPFVDGYGTPGFVKKESSGGGALFDMGVYHIAQVLHLLGNPAVETVSGATHQALAMYEERAKSAGYNVEELGLGFVRLAGGISLAIEESWAVHYDGSECSKVLGSQGGIKLTKPPVFFSKAGDVEYKGEIELGVVDTRWRRCQEGYAAYDNSQQHWIAALQERTELLDTAGIARNVALISEGIYRSQEQRRELAAEEIAEASRSTALRI